jgi:C4-type Zn-finger protein
MGMSDYSLKSSEKTICSMCKQVVEVAAKCSNCGCDFTYGWKEEDIPYMRPVFKKKEQNND